MLKFCDRKLVSFDCYGTLIDWETGILSALKPIMARHNVRLSDAEILQRYARIESSLQRSPYQPYRAILREVVRQFASELKFECTSTECDALPKSLADWKPFPDAVAALQALKSRFQIAILSNVDDDLFAATAERLEVTCDFIVTAQQLHSYKPSVKHFQELLQRSGLAPSQILHVAGSIYHDIVPARRLGFAAVWVHRQSGTSPCLTGTPDATAQPDLEVADLQSLVRKIEHSEH